jgi:hypothetical protein
MNSSFLFAGNKELMTEILANNDAYSLSVRVRRNRGGYPTWEDCEYFLSRLGDQAKVVVKDNSAMAAAES